MCNKSSDVLWGLFFIIIGVVIALNQLGICAIYFEGWWTLFIIIPCLISMVKHGPRFGNIFGLIIGLLFYLSENSIISWDIVGELMLPLILVMIGISVIFKNNMSSTKSEMAKLNKDGLTEYSAVFGSQNVRVPNAVFNGAELNAIFGGIDFNLTDAVIDHDVVIQASAIFGGLDIIAPSNVNIKVSSTPIFGGVSNKIKQTNDENAHTIYVNALCMFGGVEIK